MRGDSHKKIACVVPTPTSSSSSCLPTERSDKSCHVVIGTHQLSPVGLENIRTCTEVSSSASSSPSSPSPSSSMTTSTDTWRKWWCSDLCERRSCPRRGMCPACSATSLASEIYKGGRRKGGSETALHDDAVNPDWMDEGGGNRGR